MGAVGAGVLPTHLAGELIRRVDPVDESDVINYLPREVERPELGPCSGTYGMGDLRAVKNLSWSRTIHPDSVAQT